MPYRIKVQNKMGDWYQIFPDDVKLKSFLKVMKEQGAIFQEDGSFTCEIYEIQPVIDSIEEYIKGKQKEFNSPRALRTRIQKRQLEMDQGIYKVVPNSLFDLTNDFVPSTRKKNTGYDIEPAWRIIEKNATHWFLFTSFNFMKFLEGSIIRSDILTFKLREHETILIKGVNE